MSEPQLISPLLDGFVMGDPISNHDGVRSCPAMQLETDKKYIVKIVSLPASQAKLAALILAGAFANRETALEYFKGLADGVVEEIELLQRLAKHEGFLAFEDWQMVTMEENEAGYDIYMLSEYRPTLENVLRGNEMTHLQAVNLGLDLCTALSVARRFGHIYCNLRPSNIYVYNEKDFRIGDLGFLSLDSLAFISLPDKYRSDYTPPEVSDAFSTLNSTMDTYALGLILYQAFNDGKLPPVGIAMDAPRYADLELSEIILKACALNPEDRWQDPVQMGQALANYLQTNTVNNTPIVPVPEETEEIFEEEVIAEVDAEPTTEDILAEVDQALESAPPIISAPVEESPDEEIAEEESSVEEATDPEPAENEPEAEEESAIVEEAEEIPEETEAAEADEAEEVENPTEETEEPTEETEEPVDETAEMLAQADELIAHQLPEPPVAPEPYEVTLPVAEETLNEEETEAEESTEEIEETEAAEKDTEEIAVNEDEAEEEPSKAPPKKRSGWVAVLIILLSLLVLITAGILFYQNYYLQTVHEMTLSGSEDKLTVTLTTDIEEGKLSVKCQDLHGSSLIVPVENGVARFTGLKPGTAYKLEVIIDGFHQLQGKTTQSYTTANQTIIDNFQAKTGDKDGSVILSFSPRGTDSTQWKVEYYTNGEELKTVIFNGHTTTINDLTVGKTYTFTLNPVTSLYLGGTTSITHTASALVYAEDLEILDYTDNRLAVTWKIPENTNISKWIVRCYNDTGYSKTITTTENIVYFEDLDLTSAYTIDVTAEGMTLAARTYLSANSVIIKNIQVDASNRNELKVSWECDATTPAEGWLLLYTINDSEEQQVVQCNNTNGVITPLIPGAKYTITIQPADGITPLGGKQEFTAPEAPGFSGYLVSAENIDFQMCITPKVENWNRNDVPAQNYTTTFKVGESASFVMHLDRDTSKSTENVVALYVIRDAEGNIISCKYESRTWNSMWNQRYGKLTIPAMPEQPGTYTVAVYFNGTAATNQTFEITAP